VNIKTLLFFGGCIAFVRLGHKNLTNKKYFCEEMALIQQNSEKKSRSPNF
jgi:hypothetical protein